MFYDAVRNDHGMRYDPFKALVAPRPIGWISTISPEGIVNLAPYSFFNALSSRPNIVMFSSNDYKDSARNVDATGEFVCNLATFDLKDRMNETSAPVPPDVSEFEISGLTATPSRMVRPPRIKESPVALECRHLQTLDLKTFDGKSAKTWAVFGQVVGVHIDDSLIIDGKVDITRARPLSRLGYMDYAVTDEVFQMRRPDESTQGRKGEG